MFRKRPHVRFDGLYVSRNTYIHVGVTEWKIKNPVHLVAYFRYLRFFPNGSLLSRTSPEVRPTLLLSASRCSFLGFASCWLYLCFTVPGNSSWYFLWTKICTHIELTSVTRTNDPILKKSLCAAQIVATSLRSLEDSRICCTSCCWEDARLTSASEFMTSRSSSYALLMSFCVYHMKLQIAVFQKLYTNTLDQASVHQKSKFENKSWRDAFRGVWIKHLARPAVTYKSVWKEMQIHKITQGLQRFQLSRLQSPLYHRESLTFVGSTFVWRKQPIHEWLCRLCPR